MNIQHSTEASSSSSFSKQAQTGVVEKWSIGIAVPQITQYSITPSLRFYLEDENEDEDEDD
jgi:hypothetical protein